MNIFFLHLNVHICAKYYLDKHVIKIILEITQMLYTAHWEANCSDLQWVDGHNQALGRAPYRKTHFNHPTSKWVRQCEANYKYACSLALALCHEYTTRYRKIHKCQARIQWLVLHSPRLFCSDPIQAYIATNNIPPGCTPIPLAMPEQFHSNNVLRSYRHYYLEAKTHIVTSKTDMARFNYLKQDCTVTAQVIPKSKISSRAIVIAVAL
jgi:hypothetical protein